MQTITIRDDIVVQVPNGPIGLSYSGGVDSTILLYLLMNQTDSPIHLFTLCMYNRKFSHMKTAFDIIDKCSELTGNYNLVHHVQYEKDTTSTLNNFFKTPKEYIYTKGIVNSMFTGSTCDPPHDVTKTWNVVDSRQQHIIVERDPTVVRSIHFGPSWLCPLTNLNKQQVTKLYYDNNILESVFPLTKSCYTDYGQDACNNCWFCKEREWGLNFPR